MERGHALPAEFQGAVGDVAAALQQADVGRQIGLAAATAIPQLARRSDPELIEEAVLAATANVTAIVDGLLDGTDPGDVPVPAESLKWADWLVTRNIDVSAVPWAYSFGSSRMCDALSEIVGQLDLPGEQRWQLGDRLTRYVQVYVESICAQMVDHFVEVERTWRAGTPAIRRRIVEALLAGEAVDIAEASTSLRYDLRAAHLAAIVWPAGERDARPSARTLATTAELLLRACGASEVLVIANADSSAWAWGRGERLTEQPDIPGLGDEMTGSIGMIADGPSGFVRSHQDAQRAREVAQLLSRRPGSVVPYRAVALTALVSQDPAQALRFVESELGGLIDDSDSARRLRVTLAAYLDEGMRPVRTARRLGVHQNTVAYRINQAEQAIGRPLTERRLELETALRLADALELLRSSTQQRDDGRPA